jgi:hypothetical protein
MRIPGIDLAAVVLAPLLLTGAVAARAAGVISAVGEVSVATQTALDSVTVGQRFRVTYRFSFADSLRAVVPRALDAGTCRVMSLAWNETHDGKRVERVADVTFIPLSVDSSVVPANPFDFVSPRGDTLRAWSDEVRVPIKLIAAGAKDVRPLKEQWKAPPNYLLWGAIAAGVVALLAALVWWIRRRRAARSADPVLDIRLPADVAALAELDRIANLGLVARGEHKAHYTLVVDALRRYLEARYGVEAMDRTTVELLHDLEGREAHVDGLGAVLDEADLVKFAKFTPSPEAGLGVIARARDIVITTTPRVEPEAVAATTETFAGEGA